MRPRPKAWRNRRLGVRSAEVKGVLHDSLTAPIDQIGEGVSGFFRLPVVGITPSRQFTTLILPPYVEHPQFLENTAKATPAQVVALEVIEEIGMELGAELRWPLRQEKHGP